MNKFFKENFNILVVGVVVIFGVFFFSFNKGDKEELKVIENEEIGQIEETEDQAKVDSLNNLENKNETEIDTEKKVDDEQKALKEKFGTEIDKGSKAFLEGDYNKAIVYYNEALTYMESSMAYNRLYDTYNVLGNTDKALEMIDNAIRVSSDNTSFWISKILFLDERTDATFAELNKVYKEGYEKSDSRTKVNLVLAFTQVAENNGEKEIAISLWEEAIGLYPDKTELYQAEIDRLKNK